MAIPATDFAVKMNAPRAAEALDRLFPGRAFLLYIAPRLPGQHGELTSNCQDPAEVARLMRFMLDAVAQAGKPVAPEKTNLTGGGR